MKRTAFPLTSLQRAMLLASRRLPGSGVYLVQDICETTENLDLGALRRAWSRVSRLHEGLRTRFESTATAFEQWVDDDIAYSWREFDWRAMDGAAARRALDSLLERDRARGFDFGAGPPMRFHAIRMPNAAWVIVWTIHHAAMDGRSNQIVWSDLFTAYEAASRGREAQLPPAPPFRDHVEFVRTLDATRAGEYWQGRLAGLSQTAGFVADRLRPDSSGRTKGDFGKATLDLSEDRTRALDEFARVLGLNINSLVQAAWALLLSRCSGNRDVVFGVTSACRRSSGTGADRMVGTLINTLPFRVDVDPEAEVAAWLKNIRAHGVEMRRYEHTPIETVWQAGGKSGTRPFDSVVVYEHAPVAQTFWSRGGNWRFRTVRRVQRTDLPLTLAAYGKPRIVLDLIYDTALFTCETMTGLAACLGAILEGFVAGAHGTVSQIGVLPELERRRVVHDLNRTQRDFPRDSCAHHLVEEQARRSPKRIALEQGGRIITYGELDGRAWSAACALREMGARRKNLIAVLMRRSPEAVIAILAALKAGSAFLPLDPDLPAERLSGMLEEAAPAVVVGCATDLAGLSRKGPVLCLDDPPLVPYELVEDTTAGDPAYAIYTSGSTGKPKAVLVSHRALVNHALAAGEIFGITPLDRRLQFASIGSDVFVAEVFNYLAHGATLVFGAGPERASIAEFAATLEQHKVTIAGLPATWWSEWVNELKTGGSRVPQSLRAVIVGMERVSSGAAGAWRELAPSIRLFNAYGPAETAMTATTYEAGSSDWESRSYVPIGMPIANMRAYVLDSAGHPTPSGIAGELCLAGVGVGLGYLGAPQLTAERFQADPFQADPDGRMYRTGDTAFRLPDGNLVLLGRSDRQVKIRGFRVELEEVEATLAGNPSVAHCAVTVDDRGQYPRLAAYIVPAGSGPPSVRDLRSYLGRTLPAHMIPPVFVMARALPRTASGKIDHRSLPALEDCAPMPENSRAAPRTATEIQLSGLWAEALGRQGIGVHDDFFETGGDSLGAAALVQLVRERFGRDLPLAAFFQGPTIAHMALMLESNGGNALDAGAIALRESGSRIPMFCVTWERDDPYCFRHLSRELGAEQPFYALRNPLSMEERMATVENLASRVHRTIGELKPHGPYVLGGFCFGGVLAFETARQMVEAGEEVRLVALFDAAAPGFPKLASARYWRRVRDLVRQAIRGSVKIRREDIAGHLRVLRELAARRVGAAAMRSAARAGATAVIPPAETLGALMRRSLTAYKPRPLDVPTVQFLARDEPISARILEDPRLGWPELCPKHRLLRVPGTHSELLAPPGAGEIAVILRELLTTG